MSQSEQELQQQRAYERERAEEQRMLDALAEAKPTFMKDPHGLRGPQREINSVTIAGADGGQGNFQVRKPKSSAVTSIGQTENTNSWLLFTLNENGVPTNFLMNMTRKGPA